MGEQYMTYNDTARLGLLRQAPWNEWAIWKMEVWMWEMEMEGDQGGMGVGMGDKGDVGMGDRYGEKINIDKHTSGYPKKPSLRWLNSWLDKYLIDYY